MRNIIILGSGPGWETCPFDKETWVVGKMIMLGKPIGRIDMLFSMDDFDHWLSIRRGGFTKEQYVARVVETNVPYYSSVRNDNIPTSREYPMKDVLAKLKVPYFSNTVCYMLAYAIFQRVQSISLYGIGQMGTHEYVAERAGVEFWLGMAMGMGIEVNIMTTSLLLQNNSGYPYGYVETIGQLKEKGKI